MEEDVLSALMNLGYQRPMAEKALASAVKNGLGKEKSSFDSLFREALASLSK
jgi:Holliday junction resolvasome RuvABC DNA-binding subunit